MPKSDSFHNLIDNKTQLHPRKMMDKTRMKLFLRDVMNNRTDKYTPAFYASMLKVAKRKGYVDEDGEVIKCVD